MKRAADLVWVYITCASTKEAAELGRALVQEPLAACVNLLGPVRSLYRWKGRIHAGREVALVKGLHRYEVPCVVALPIKDGTADFLRWLEKETKP